MQIIKTAKNIVILAFVVSAMPSYASVTFSALKKGHWQGYSSDVSGQSFSSIGESAFSDVSSITSNGRQSVAYELQQAGIRICDIGSATSCKSLSDESALAVRPAWNAQSNELIYVRYQATQTGEDSDLYLHYLESGASKPLILQTGVQDYPDVSSDGRWLAYMSSDTVSLYRGGVQVIRNLWTMDLTTGIAKQITYGNHQDIEPDWSPDVTQLAFASNRSGDFEIWLSDNKGENAKKLTTGPGQKTWPSWSPDGKSIMYTLQHQGRYSLWMIDVDGTNLRQFQPFGKEADVQMKDADWN